MSSDTTLTRDRTDEILLAAIERQTPVLISHRSSLGWTAYQSRFTRLDAGNEQIHMRLAMRSDDPAPPAFSSGDKVGVTFRRAHKKCMFSSLVLSMDESGETFVVRRPAHFQELQRRVFERTTPPPSRSIEVLFWQLADVVDGSAAEDRVFRGVLEDISVGGSRVRAEQPCPIQLDATYCCRFKIGQFDEDLTLEAVLRHHEIPRGQHVSLGFRFIGLEASESGRQNMIRIARLVSRFQRRNSNAARIRLHRRRRSR